MSTVQQVAQHAGQGATAATIAARLAVPLDLVEAILREMGGGRPTRAVGCTEPRAVLACAPEKLSSACRGCPLAPIPRA